MAIISAALRELIAAGLEGEDLIAAVERIEAAVPNSVDEAAERRRSKDRERKRNERLRKSAESAESVEITDTAPPSPLPNVPTPLKTHTSPSQEKDPKGSQKKGSNFDEKFDAFWAAYPRRLGANPRKPAREKFILAIRSGADPASIIAAAENYRREEERSGKIGTPYVAQATTWLNQRRWEDLLADTNEKTLANHSVIEQGHRMAVERYRTNPSLWPTSLGPKPDEPDCRISPKILSEYGFCLREAA